MDSRNQNAVVVEEDERGGPLPFSVVCHACGQAWPFAERFQADLWAVKHRRIHGWHHQPHGTDRVGKER
jgi:hypothetical protein